VLVIRKGEVPQEGLYREIVGEGNEHLKTIRFGLLTLEGEQTFAEETGEHEVALVILGGRCTLVADDRSFGELGTRRDVFSGRATGVYIPAGSRYAVTGTGPDPCEIAVCRVPAERTGEVTVVRPDEVEVVPTGAGNWSRRAENIILDNVNAARLMVGETFNPPGNWSSYPPHKHDVDDLPDEVKLEEVYHFRLRPSQGFAIQRVYSPTNDLDEAYVVRDGDSVLLPYGYHPVAAAPGYQVYYLWALAGEKRMMRPHDDPEHAWIKGCEAILRGS